MTDPSELTGGARLPTAFVDSWRVDGPSRPHRLLGYTRIARHGRFRSKRPSSLTCFGVSDWTRLPAYGLPIDFDIIDTPFAITSKPLRSRVAMSPPNRHFVRVHGRRRSSPTRMRCNSGRSTCSPGRRHDISINSISARALPDANLIYSIEDMMRPVQSYHTRVRLSSRR
jgi:hypothetical protein